VGLEFARYPNVWDVGMKGCGLEGNGRRRHSRMSNWVSGQQRAEGRTGGSASYKLKPKC